MTEEVPSLVLTETKDENKNDVNIEDLGKNSRNTLRSDLIKKGIQFLIHPNIQKTVPLSRRIDFLMEKGLTDEEIEIAVAESRKNESDRMNPIGIKLEPQSYNYERKEDSMVTIDNKDRTQNKIPSSIDQEYLQDKKDIFSQEFLHDSSSQRHNRTNNQRYSLNGQESTTTHPQKISKLHILSCILGSTGATGLVMKYYQYRVSSRLQQLRIETAKQKDSTNAAIVMLNEKVTGVHHEQKNFQGNIEQLQSKIDQLGQQCDNFNQNLTMTNSSQIQSSMELATIKQMLNRITAKIDLINNGGTYSSTSTTNLGNETITNNDIVGTDHNNLISSASSQSLILPTPLSNESLIKSSNNSSNISLNSSNNEDKQEINKNELELAQKKQSIEKYFCNKKKQVYKVLLDILQANTVKAEENSGKKIEDQTNDIEDHLIEGKLTKEKQNDVNLDGFTAAKLDGKLLDSAFKMFFVYINNLLKYPNNPQMRKITFFSNAYKSNVKPLKGHEHFLETLGYEFNESSDAYEWTLHANFIEKEDEEAKISLEDGENKRKIKSMQRDFADGLLKEATEALQHIQKAISLDQEKESIAEWLEGKAAVFDLDLINSISLPPSDSKAKISFESSSLGGGNQGEVENQEEENCGGGDERGDNANEIVTEREIKTDKKLGKKEDTKIERQRIEEKINVETMLTVKGEDDKNLPRDIISSNLAKGNINNIENGQLSGNDLTLAEITAMQEQGIQPPDILNIDNDRISVDVQKYFQSNSARLNVNEDSSSNPNTSRSLDTPEKKIIENRRKPWQDPK